MCLYNIIFYFIHCGIGDGSVGTYFNNDRWQQYEENDGLFEPAYLIQHFKHHLLPQAKLIVILRNPIDR